MTEDEMIGWHHRLDGCEFEQALGAGEGQGSLAACCSPWGLKESDMTERLNNNNGMQRLLSVSLMVTIMHKAIIDIQKIMRKESKCNTTESHQTMREESEKPEKKNNRDELQNSEKKKFNKMAISTHLLIIILNVKGLICPIKRHILTEWIKENKTHLYAA